MFEIPWWVWLGTFVIAVGVIRFISRFGQKTHSDEESLQLRVWKTEGVHYATVGRKDEIPTPDGATSVFLITWRASLHDAMRQIKDAGRREARRKGIAYVHNLDEPQTTLERKT